MPHLDNSENIDGLQLEEQTADLETPIAGYMKLYAKDDSFLYFRNDAGTVVKLALITGVLQDLDTLGPPSTDGEFIVATAAGVFAYESGATARTSLGLTIGTDVLAQQPIGIADNNLVEIDDADAADNDFAKFTANGLEGRSYAEVRSDINVEDGADVTDATNVNAAGAVMETDYNAQTILAATADNTPAALTVNEQTLVGRITSGNIASLTVAQIKTLLGLDIGEFTLTGAGGWPSTTSGSADPQKIEFTTNDVDMYLADYDDSTDEYQQWTFFMPHDYDGGTITVQKFAWTADDTSTDSVVLACQGRAYVDGDAIDQAWGTAQSVTDANDSTAYEVRLSGATSAITLAGNPGANALVQIRAYRDADNGSDTLTGDARIIALLIRYNRT